MVLGHGALTDPPRASVEGSPNYLSLIDLAKYVGGGKRSERGKRRK
jgi:hypothetical protein